MDNILEYLLPIVIFLAFVLPKLFKRADRKRAETATKQDIKKGGLFDRLNKILEEYQESEKKSASAREEIDDYDAWMYKSEEQEKEADNKNDNVDVSAKMAKPVPMSKSKKPQQSMHGSKSKTVSQPMQPTQPMKPPSGKTASHHAYMVSKVKAKEFRSAIVWSEILSKPVALRDD